MPIHASLVRRAAALLLFAGVLAACGGGGGSDGVASLGGGNSEDAASSSDGKVSDADRQDAMLNFAKCMREHGVDMPDPQTSSDGKGDVVIRGGPVGGGGEGAKPSAADEKKFQDADKACQHFMKDAFGDRPQLSPEEEAQMRDDALAFAKCMREHGVDMPDPTFDSGGRGFTQALGGDNGIDPESSTFQAAQQACQDKLGFGKGRGPGFTVNGGKGSTGSSTNSASASAESS